MTKISRDISSSLTLFMTALILLACAIPQAGTDEATASFVAGAFRTDNGRDLDADTDSRKLKYPLILDGKIAFLEVDTSGSKRVFVFRIGDALVQGSRVGRAVVLHGGSSGGIGSEQSSIQEFFRCGAYSEVKAGSKLVVSSLADGRELASGYIRDFVDPDGPLLINSEGLWRGNTLLFSCGEVISADASGRSIAVSYHDETSTPRVALVHGRGNGCSTKPISDHREILPVFSDSGRLLAVTRAVETGMSNLHVYMVSGRLSLGSPVTIESEIEVYDIRGEVFFYPSSYSWLGETLFFIRRSSSSMKRELWMLACDSQRQQCSRKQIRFPEKVQIETVSGRTRDRDAILWMVDAPGQELVEYELHTVVWAVPFRHGGAVYLAAQGMLRTRMQQLVSDGNLRQLQFPCSSGYCPWVSRILIFRLHGCTT